MLDIMNKLFTYIDKSVNLKPEMVHQYKDSLIFINDEKQIYHPLTNTYIGVGESRLKTLETNAANYAKNIFITANPSANRTYYIPIISGVTAGTYYNTYVVNNTSLGINPYSKKFVGNLTGTADYANISHIGYKNLLNDTSTDQSYYITFANRTSGNSYTYVQSDLNYNPNKNILHSSYFQGYLDGTSTYSTYSTYSYESLYSSYFDVQFTSTSNAYHVVFVNGLGQRHAYVGSNLSFNPSNSTLTTSTFKGNLDGSATMLDGHTSSYYQSALFIGENDTLSSSSYSNPYIKFVDNGLTLKNQYQIKGEGTVNVNSDSNGNITISSLDNLPKAVISTGTTPTTTAGEVYGIVGSTTSGARIPTRWFVNLDNGVTELTDGMIISFRLPTAGLGTVGECLTIDNNQDHFHQIVFSTASNTNSLLTTHFGINSVITVQYDATISVAMYGKYDATNGVYVHNGNTTTSKAGVWRVLSLWDSGNTDVRYQQTIYYNNRKVISDGALKRYTLCMMNKNGEITSLTLTDNGYNSTDKTMYSGYLDPRKIYYWNTSTNVAGGANSGSANVLLTHNGDLIDYRYTFNCSTTLRPRTSFYIVGTIDNNGFKLDTTKPWSDSLPTEEDGKVYIYVGMIYIDASAYRGTLEEVNTIYWYKDGAVREYYNVDDVYVNQTGDTMTGPLEFNVGEAGYDDNMTYGGINMNKSNIINLNSIYTAYWTTTAKNGIHFYRDDTHVDSIHAYSGNLYFTPNRELGTDGTPFTILHSNNYSSYLGYIAKTPVQATATVQDIVGTGNIVPDATDLKILGSYQISWANIYSRKLQSTNYLTITAGNSILLQNNNTEVARVNQHAKFGVGPNTDTNNTYMLYVNGMTYINGRTKINRGVLNVIGEPDHSYTQGIRIHKVNGDFSSIFFGAVNDEGYDPGMWQIGKDSSGFGIIGSAETTSSTFDSVDYIHIKYGGNVGINTRTPSHKLEVNGNGYFAKTIYSGVSSSTDLTHIPTESEVALTTGNGNGSVSAWIWRENFSSSNWGIFHNNDTNYIHFVGDNTARLSINLSNGNVGIGTATQTYKLQIAGNVYSSGFRHSAINSNDYILLAGGGYKALNDFNDYLSRLRRLNLEITHDNNGMFPPTIFELKNAGYPLFTDPEFASGNNTCAIYNNSNGGAVTITRQEDDQGSANSSGYILKIETNGTASPNAGGIRQQFYGRANAIFIQIVRAKIPLGYDIICTYHNQGTGSTYKMLTSNKGTGKWEWYVVIDYCGTTGTFTYGGYLYIKTNGTVSGLTNTNVTWYISYANVIDITKGNYDGLRVRYADNADIATSLSSTDTYKAWGQTFFNNGIPVTHDGPITNVENITPLSNAGYNLGSSAKRWLNIYGRNLQSDTTLYLDSASSTSIIFRIGGVEKARFCQPNGYLCIGVTSPSYSIHTSGTIGGNGIFANISSSDTANGLSLYGSALPHEYGIAMRTTNTTTFARIGRVQGNLATFFTMNDTTNRGWIFRSGTTSYASISTRGEGYFTAIGNDGYIAYPNGGRYSIRDGGTSVTGAICIELPVSWTATMMRFVVDIYNYKESTPITYVVGGYNYTGNGGQWVNTSAYALRPQNKISGNLPIRFGHNGTHCCIYIGETNSLWSYPQIVVRNFQGAFNNYDYNTWASGWTISLVTEFGTLTDGTTIINPAVNYLSDYAKLLYPQTSTTTGVTSTWGVVPSGCVKVWSEKFTDTSLTYTPSGGSATQITDSGDVVMWLKPGATTNSATLNMRIDGMYYADGFYHTTAQNNNYVLLAGGSYKSWTTTATNNAIVSRDASGNIMGKYFYSDITNENLTIGSVFVTNTSDNAIRKISLSNFVSQVDNSDIITITKSIQISDEWGDTGITTESGSGKTFPSDGTYAVQININNQALYSGVMTVFNNGSGSESEEIILHCARKSNYQRLYLRTLQLSSGYSNIQISTSVSYSSSYSVTFKFRKLI